uniref:Uncharacterized protein n=1 Tax=Arundo donax TaxID=35708 RepID=A0A0A9GXH6_ARUDO
MLRYNKRTKSLDSDKSFLIHQMCDRPKDMRSSQINFKQ